VGKPVLIGQTQELGIRIIVEDLLTGDRAEKTIQPGNYAIIAAAPCHVAGEQHHANGTTVLTLKGRERSLLSMAVIEPEVPDVG
jgi:hypothetical protein